jgi:hypothetical protein
VYEILIKGMKKLFFSIVLIIGLLYLPFSLELMLFPFEADLTKDRNIRISGHFNKAKSWFNDSGPKLMTKGGFGETVYLMGHSYFSIGLWNLHKIDNAKYKSAIKTISYKLANNVLKDLFLKKIKIEKIELVKGNGILLGHTNLVLIIHRILTGDKSNDQIIEKISENLFSQSQRESYFFIPPPYKDTKDSSVFPADHSVTLLSLFLADQNLGTKYFKSVYQLFLGHFENGKVYHKYGVHKSGENYKWENIPRGVGVAYELSNMIYYDNEKAKEIYKSFVKNFKIDALVWFRAIREWPIEHEGTVDIDSGPIFFEIGTGASALSLGPSHYFLDLEMYRDLQIIGGLVGIPILMSGKRRYLLLDVLFEVLKSLPVKNKKLADLINSFHFFTDTSLFSAVVSKNQEVKVSLKNMFFIKSRIVGFLIFLCCFFIIYYLFLKKIWNKLVSSRCSDKS